MWVRFFLKWTTRLCCFTTALLLFYCCFTTGVPEALPEMDDEIMEEFNIEDSDIEREKGLHGQRGSYFRGAVPPVREDIASEIAGSKEGSMLTYADVC